MTRIPPLDPATVFGGSDPSQTDGAEFARKMMGYVPNDALVMAHWPELLDAMRGMVGVIYGESRLDAGIKRLVGHAASLAAGCRYCQAHSGDGAAKAGIAPAKLAAMMDFEDSPHFDERERAAIALGFAAGAVPNRAEDAHFARLSKHFDAREQVEIMAVIAMFGFLNHWNDTLATDLEAEPLAFAESALSESGWEAGKHGG